MVPSSYSQVLSVSLLTSCMIFLGGEGGGEGIGNLKIILEITTLKETDQQLTELSWDTEVSSSFQISKRVDQANNTPHE